MNDLYQESLKKVKNMNDLHKLRKETLYQVDYTSQYDYHLTSIYYIYYLQISRQTYQVTQVKNDEISDQRCQSQHTQK